MKHFTSLCPALFCVQAICAKCLKSQTITLLRDIKHILHGTAIKLKEQHEETSIGCWAKESHALCMFSVRNAENNYVTWMKVFISVPVIVNLQNNEEIPHSCNLTLTKFDSLMSWLNILVNFLCPAKLYFKNTACPVSCFLFVLYDVPTLKRLKIVSPHSNKATGSIPTRGLSVSSLHVLRIARLPSTLQRHAH